MAESYDETKRGGETKDEFVIKEFKVTLGERSIIFQIDFSGVEPRPPYTANPKIAELVGPILDEKGFLDEDGRIRGHVRCLERARQIDDNERQLVITYLKQTD